MAVDIFGAPYGTILIIEALPVAYTVEENERLSQGEEVKISVSTNLRVTAEFDEWAKMWGVVYSVGWQDNRAVIHMESDEHALWFKLRWM
jgi:hypothetical protein